MGRLELVNEGADGVRHYLDGEPVHAGDSLEMLTGSGWRRGRYEWNFRWDGPPVLFWNDERGVSIGTDDELRWPSSCS